MSLSKERILLILPALLIFSLAFKAIRPELGKQLLLKTKNFWLKKTFDNNKYDVIICGDSRVYRGVSPQAMNSEFENTDILNFGFSSGGYSDIMYRAINHRLDSKSERKILILGISPYSLTPRAAQNKSLYHYQNIKREERIENQYFSGVLEFFIPFTPIELERKMIGKSFLNPKIETFNSSGWVASDFVNRDPEYALKSYQTTFNNNQVSEQLVHKLCLQISEWKSEDIEIYAYRPPTTNKMVTLEDSLSGFKQSEIILALKEAGAQWIDLSDQTYYSYDGSHLQEKSAIQFSIDLAQKINHTNNYYNETQ